MTLYVTRLGQAVHPGPRVAPLPRALLLAATSREGVLRALPLAPLLLRQVLGVLAPPPLLPALVVRSVQEGLALPHARGGGGARRRAPVNTVRDASSEYGTNKAHRSRDAVEPAGTRREQRVRVLPERTGDEEWPTSRRWTSWRMT